MSENNSSANLNQNFYFIIVLTICTLMFFQSIRLLMSIIYYENLTGMGLQPSALYTLVFFSPLLLLFLKYINLNVLLALSGISLVVNRILASLNLGADMFLLNNALVIVSYGIYIPSFLTIYYSLHGKSRLYAKSIAAIIAPFLALIIDLAFRVLGDSYDISVGGIISSKSSQVINPLMITIPLAILAIIFIIKGFFILKTELPSMRTVQRSGKKTSSIIPGFSLGLLYIVFFSLLGYPGIGARWGGLNYTTTVIVTVLCLLVILLLLLFKEMRLILFNPISQIILNAVQFFTIVDILFIESGAAQFTFGIACGSMLLNIYILYHAVGIKNYSIGYFIRLLTMAILTFIILYFIIIFTLVWAHIGPLGLALRDKLPILIVSYASIYILASLIFNRIITNTIKNRSQEA